MALVEGLSGTAGASARIVFPQLIWTRTSAMSPARLNRSLNRADDARQEVIREERSFVATRKGPGTGTHATVRMSASCYRARNHTLSDLVAASLRPRRDISRVLRFDRGRAGPLACSSRDVRFRDELGTGSGLSGWVACDRPRRPAGLRARLRPG